MTTTHGMALFLCYAARMRNANIKFHSVEIGLIDGYEYWITSNPMYERMRESCPSIIPDEFRDHILDIFSGYNGYIVFPKRPVQEKDRDGIIQYVPVHGGITYAHESIDCMVYGFDTAHFNSHPDTKKSLAWIKAWIMIMLDGIKIAADLEDVFLAADGDEETQSNIGNLVSAVALGHIPHPKEMLKNLLEVPG